MHKISTEIKSLANHVGYEKAIELIGKAGFECWDFSMFDMISYNWTTKEFGPGILPLLDDGYREFDLKLRKIGEKYGMECNQAYAPFSLSIDGIEPYIIRSIECASSAGAKAIVVHPYNDASNQENTKMFRFYLKFIHKFNIKIATESMWNWNKEKDCASIPK